MKSLLLVVLLVASPGLVAAASAQHLRATIGLPGTGPARFLTVSVDPEADDVALVGCVSSAPGVCFATSRIALSRREARALRDHIAAAATRMRCPAPRALEGDPAFSITMASGTYEGTLPRDVAQIEARTSGTCAASARLAWWLVQHFGVPGPTDR